MFGRTILTHFNKVGINRGAQYSYCSALPGRGFNKKHKVQYLYFEVQNNMGYFMIYKGLCLFLMLK